jgi:hypothetical protein
MMTRYTSSLRRTFRVGRRVTIYNSGVVHLAYLNRTLLFGNAFSLRRFTVTMIAGIDGWRLAGPEIRTRICNCSIFAESPV